MNLAPYVAYKQQGGLSDRKVARVQRYYTSADDLQAGRAAGKLNKDTPVTLSDTIVTRSSDRRQFTEVAITSETKNAAGETLAAGTKVWTVSDRGSLKAAASAPVPSWWAKCSPAYTSQPEGLVNCTSRTDWSYYLSSEDVLQYKNAGRLAADFPLSYEPGNAPQQLIRPGRNPGDAAKTFSLVTLGRDKDKLKKGDRVWVVSDGDSLTPVLPAASGSEPVYNDVCVPSSPVPVSAGDSLGHMGFYQLPEENGKRSRYQVHIECLSTDDMETFITNPGRAGEDSPAYLTWQKDASLSDKSDAGITAGSRKTKTPGILTLSDVPGVDAAGNSLTSNQDAAYYQIRPEGGWLPAASVKQVSQYALGELGYVTLNRIPVSFNLIDGTNQPDNVVKGILEQLHKAAQDETRTTHALNKYSYQRLLEMIDTNQDGYYSEQEYLQAVHNTSYRDRLYRVIARHASECYAGKDDPLWKAYLDTLTTDAPLWKTYLETFLDRMTWMKKTAEKGVALGPEPWHMHPVVFLDALSSSSLITLEMVLAANLNDNKTQCERVLPYLNKYSKAYKMIDKKEIAHFLSQIGHESGFNITEENLNYSAKGMRKIFGCIKGPAQYNKNTDDCNLGRLRDKLWTQESTYAHKPENLANYVYASRMGNGKESSGEGYRYRGRGMNHLTGKDGYRFFTNKYNEMNADDKRDFVENPDLVISNIEYGVESAFSFWASKKLNKIASILNVYDVTQKVNGGQNGYSDRLQRFNATAPLLGVDKE